MNRILSGVPAPDVEALKQILRRERKSKRVHVGELRFDRVVIRELAEKVFGLGWIEPGENDRLTQEEALRRTIGVFRRLGFDCVRLSADLRFGANIVFPSRPRIGTDTAALKKSERQWTEEGRGPIASWEEFETYPWPDGTKVDLRSLEFTGKNLPEGMGMWGCITQGVLEIAVNTLMGYETLSYLLYDEPELVAAVFDRVGRLILDGYRRQLGLPGLVGFFQGDDMGFKTSTLVSPDVLRRYVLPWHKKFAELAHQNGLLYVLHSCGNLTSIMDDLIDDVKIDAKHSFEDAIMPVTEFARKYGDRVAIMGGVDVDKLCGLGEKDLRAYVRNILDICMEKPGYVLGSGNSIANYIPIENYLIMVDEGYRYFG